MPIKILLADKSITIQKVVEMLFSGKEYEVLCVSDGDTALNEAARIAPDVVLADIDLPRLDGYSFSARLRNTPALAQTPVILMMSRDDVFDTAKARQASIIDHISKPFESQELIGKVKKAVSGALPRPAEPAPLQQAAKAKPKPAPPSDIFDIIQQAPSSADLGVSASNFGEDESVYEVEPVVEVEEPHTQGAGALPEGDKAVEEMRAGLGIGRTGSATPDLDSFDPFDGAAPRAREYEPPRQPQKAETPERRAREYVPPPPEPETPSTGGAVSEERLRTIAEEIVTRITREHFKNMPRRQPQASEDAVRSALDQSVSATVRDVAREVVERVAWEVVPGLAELLIKEEIERLKSNQ